MGINAMENPVYQPEQKNTAMQDLAPWLLVLLLVAVLAYGGKWAYDHFHTPAPVSALIEKATSSVQAEYRNYCVNGQCVKVKMCTAISDECGDMTQGPKADYGTGFHKSADGRTRPNPPAGWKWAGK